MEQIISLIEEPPVPSYLLPEEPEIPVPETVENIIRHLPGKHVQKSHGHGGGGAGKFTEAKRAYVGHSEKTLNQTDAQELNELILKREVLQKAYEKYGYNDKPSVSDAEFKELKNDGATIVYRGYSGGSMSAEDMTNDFRNGEKHWVGTGQWANGTYTTTNKETAFGYSQYGMMTGTPGAVMAMAIRPEAKFVELENLIGMKDLISDDRSDLSQLFDSDPSLLALNFGFDGIFRKTQSGENHYIVLNRSAVVVPQGNE